RRAGRIFALYEVRLGHCSVLSTQSAPVACAPGGRAMAIILMEEVLVGLDEVKMSLEQALSILDVLVDDLSPRLGEALRDELESTLRRPLQGRLEALEALQAAVDALAA